MIVCLGTTPAVQRTMIFTSVRIDAVNRAIEVMDTAAGKSVNVARTLHTLGRPAVATGFLGGDSGRLIRRDLDGAAVAHDFLEVAPATRTCVTMVDRAGATATELVEEPKPVNASDYDALLEKLRGFMASAKMLVLSGSLPPGAPADFYARCAELAHGRVIVDATGPVLQAALHAKPLVAKLNRPELAQTTRMPVDTETQLRQAAAALVARGATWAVVTLGAAGALACDGRSAWRLTGPKVPVVSPVGSGDAFSAGLAAAMVDGRDIPRACTLAVACGTANAMNTPAGHGRIEDIRRLEPQITLKTEH